MINQRILSSIIEQKIDQIKHLQKDDGSWRFCFEGPPMTDAYFIIMAKSLNLNEDILVKKCLQRLKKQQDSDGLWRVFPDEPKGNLSATVEATLALILSGTYSLDDPLFKKTIPFIKQNGGLRHTGLITRTFLAMNGLYPWPTLPINPAWLVLLPKSLPVNFYSFSSYARAHFAPALVCFEHHFSRPPKITKGLIEFYRQIDEEALLDPNCSENKTERLVTFEGSESLDTTSTFWPESIDWLSESRGSIGSFLKSSLFKLKEDVTIWKTAADRWIERYILQRLTKNGTLLSYASTTYLMIYGLLALGYTKDSEIIQNAISGIHSLIWEESDVFHIQNSPSPIWDTSLLTVSLLDAGVSITDPIIEKAAHFLRDAQQEEKGDWAIHNPNTSPGGWGFSDTNTKHPDVDDTHVTLRVMAALKDQEAYTEVFNRGITWLLSMQNGDGGWAAFEKNVDQSLLTLVPAEHMNDAALDPSTADITGRTLFLFGHVLKWTPEHANAKRAIRWLKQAQNEEGSWSGRWGVEKIYGTWAALTGLAAVGINNEDPCVQKATNWLMSIQNSDGGWGESCQSGLNTRFVPHTSTIVQTAWAVDAMLSIVGPKSKHVQHGVDFLLKQGDISKQEETTHYPTGIGLPGSFYVRYHSYPYIWPLMALAHFRSS